MEKIDKSGSGRPVRDDSGEETVLDETIDLEEYAKLGRRPPLAKAYRFRIGGDSYILRDPTPTGQEVLTLANLLPAKDFTLWIKFAGKRPRKVGLDEKIDLRQLGVEQFKALPRDQTDG